MASHLTPGVGENHTVRLVPDNLVLRRGRQRRERVHLHQPDRGRRRLDPEQRRPGSLDRSHLVPHRLTMRRRRLPGTWVASTDPTGGASAWVAAPVDATGTNNWTGGVSCTTGGLCAMVDEAGDILISTAPAGGLVAWSKAAVDNFNQIDTLACPSTALCVAGDSAGNLFTSTHPSGGASAWSRVTIDLGTWINKISCPSVSLCVATDGSRRDPYLDRARPGVLPAWTRADVDGTTSVWGVSCASVSLCVAVDGNGGILTSTDPRRRSSAWTRADVDGSTLISGRDRAHRRHSCVAGDQAGNVLSSTDPAGGAVAWQSAAVGQGGIGAISSAERRGLRGRKREQASGWSSSKPEHWPDQLESDRERPRSLDGWPHLYGGEWRHRRFALCGHRQRRQRTDDVQPSGGQPDVDDHRCQWYRTSSGMSPVPWTTFCVAGDVTGSICGVSGPPPAITSVSPNSGPDTGGTSVTITGSGFSGATRVAFGGVRGDELHCGLEHTDHRRRPCTAGGLAQRLRDRARTVQCLRVRRSLHLRSPARHHLGLAELGPGRGGNLGDDHRQRLQRGDPCGLRGRSRRRTSLWARTHRSPSSPPCTSRRALHNVSVTGPAGTSASVFGDLFTYQ